MVEIMNSDQPIDIFKVTEVEIIYRNKIKPSLRPKITKSEDAYQLLIQAWDMNKIELVEQFKIILLNRSNNCIGIADISTGGVSACVVDPKIVFSIALKTLASGIILAHNHPSGNLKPSTSDKELTKKLVIGGKLLEFEILDHLIISPDEYYSLADEGLMFG